MLKEKRLILIVSLLVILFVLLITHKPDYDGKHVESLDGDDGISRQLLHDIEIFNQKYDGKGGGLIDTDLKIVLYKFKKGDSLWNIAQRTGLSMDALLSINNLENVHIIQPDTEIMIPNKDGIFYKVKPGETLEGIAEKFKVPEEDILNINEVDENSITEGEDIFIPKGKLGLEERISLLGRFLMPVFGRITSGFGWRRHPISRRRHFHTGLDIATAYGTPVKASSSGQVIFAGNYGGYGKMVILKHKGGYSTRYGHLSRIRVKHGRKVKQGQVIGYVGRSGMATGSHLHFEIRKYSKALNPYFHLRYFAKR